MIAAIAAMTVLAYGGLCFALGRLRATRYWKEVLDQATKFERHCPPHWVRDGEIEALRGVADAARRSLIEIDAIVSDAPAWQLTRSIGPLLHNRVRKLAAVYGGAQTEKENIVPDVNRQ